MLWHWIHSQLVGKSRVFSGPDKKNKKNAWIKKPRKAMGCNWCVGSLGRNISRMCWGVAKEMVTSWLKSLSFSVIDERFRHIFVVRVLQVPTLARKHWWDPQKIETVLPAVMSMHTTIKSKIEVNVQPLDHWGGMDRPLCAFPRPQCLSRSRWKKSIIRIDRVYGV